MSNSHGTLEDHQKHTVVIIVDKQMKDRIKAVAAELDMSMGAVVRLCVKKHVPVWEEEAKQRQGQ